MPPKPSWFTDGVVVMSNAPTCGINKDGNEQYEVDPETGQRVEGEIDNKLYEDTVRVVEKNFSEGYISTVDEDKVLDSEIIVPKYYDESFAEGVRELANERDGWTTETLGTLEREDFVLIRGGHGSPSKDQRVGGDVAYIKVSDLRAGHVNINPTNMVPRILAKEDYWDGDTSGLKAYDLISPQRASKNIGEFCVLMPGQESLIITKEVIVVRALNKAPFDQFFMMWALSLEEVQRQWERIVFMQTNRQDAGNRYREIEIPIPPSSEEAAEVSEGFRNYYETLDRARKEFIDGMQKSDFEHHIHLE